MSTSIALASMANTQALIAQQQADHAAKVACEVMMPAYTHQGASIEQMHNYADCVGRLYPVAMSSDSVIWLKVAIVLLFVGAIVGAWREKNTYDGPIHGAFFGLIVVLLSEVVIFLILAALVFLFS